MFRPYILNNSIICLDNGKHISTFLCLPKGLSGIYHTTLKKEKTEHDHWLSWRIPSSFFFFFFLGHIAFQILCKGTMATAINFLFHSESWHFYIFSIDIIETTGTIKYTKGANIFIAVCRKKTEWILFFTNTYDCLGQRSSFLFPILWLTSRQVEGYKKNKKSNKK